MNAKRAAVAGAIGTAAMTALLLIEPSIGLPEIAVGQLLSSLMSVSIALFPVGAAGGWLLDLLVGIVLALVYAKFVIGLLPGSALVRGLIYGAIVFVAAQLAFTPLVGQGVFSRGDVQLLCGSLLGHLVYGASLGWIYGGVPADGAATAA